MNNPLQTTPTYELRRMLNDQNPIVARAAHIELERRNLPTLHKGIGIYQVKLVGTY